MLGYGKAERMSSSNPTSLYWILDREGEGERDRGDGGKGTRENDEYYEHTKT